jgi:2'-5' RNA ligase
MCNSGYQIVILGGVHMQYFIGIIPPIEYQQQIIEFQKRWTNNHLPGVVEPHVTLKAQGGLTADLAWVDSVKDICSNFQASNCPL